jgi:nicotinate-nucleotide adenylyltransferase
MTENMQEMVVSRKPRLAVFGGTFDPVHNGHLYIAGELLRRGLADEVLFVPACKPPHKQSELLSAAEDRLAMLKAALSGYEEFSVSDIELQRHDHPSYTIDTLDLLKAAYPGHDLVFLMGVDSLAELHLWHRASELVGRYRFLIFPRPGAEPPPYATLAGYFGPRAARKLIDSIVDVVGVDISATAIRRYTSLQQSLAGLVPETVGQYISEHKLYSNPEDAERKEWQTPHHTHQD